MGIETTKVEYGTKGSKKGDHRPSRTSCQSHTTDRIFIPFYEELKKGNIIQKLTLVTFIENESICMIAGKTKNVSLLMIVINICND